MAIDFSKLTKEEIIKLIEQGLVSEEAAQVPPLDPPREVATQQVAEATQPAAPESPARRVVLANAVPAATPPTAEEPTKRSLLSKILPQTDEEKAALRRSLLLAGAQMMVAGGPSYTPTNTLQVIGQGLGTATQGYDSYLNGEAERGKLGATATSEKFKLQSELKADAIRTRIAEILTNAKGRNLTNDEYKEIAALQTQVGDEAGARDTLDKSAKVQ